MAWAFSVSSNSQWSGGYFISGYNSHGLFHSYHLKQQHSYEQG
jgi:hypothetical protein